ncbi:universal stress protein [Phenylobacterium sp.]|uniref:universal stress protein n=1 Tax=Phenylobacterium sp. TaxID=1871053 RepID=UPI00286CBDF1|nr:universal stress protein [Phenylobacterium sp.]
MPLKTILVHVEAEPTPDPRLALAIDIANRFDASLLGVGAELYQNAYSGDGGFDGGYMIAAETERVDADLKRAEAKFRAVAGAVRQGSAWRSGVRFPLAELAADARAADLVVASLGARPHVSQYEVALPGALVLQVGRPVLVAPPGMAGLNAAHVLVAWKDTRESRRAVADALPFLQRAETVEVVEICDSKAAQPATTSRLDDVAAYLTRHGVKATVKAHIAERDAAAAEQLLEIAEQQAADLIVAGAYGHSRLQEWVFGGFTRALLTQTGRPVLFSH